MAHMHGNERRLADLDFESLVNRYYSGLYQFGYSLSHSDADACDVSSEGDESVA